MLQYLAPVVEPPSGPYAALAPDASPPLAPVDDFLLVSPVSYGEEWGTAVEPDQQRYIDILCEGTECDSTSVSTIAIGSAAAAGAAVALAADAPAGTAAVRSSTCMRQRAAASGASHLSDATGPVEPAVPRRQRQRASEPGTPAAPRSQRQRASAATAPGTSRQQRPSALARQLRSGRKGRPRAGEGMDWQDPAVVERLRQLKQQWRDGALTQPAVAAILRREYGVARIGHATVCRQFKE